jgi:hypothetical protein
VQQVQTQQWLDQRVLLEQQELRVPQALTQLLLAQQVQRELLVQLEKLVQQDLKV